MFLITKIIHQNISVDDFQPDESEALVSEIKKVSNF